MKRSSNRILSTHVGSLGKPQHLFEMLRQRIQGNPVDNEAIAMESRQAVMDSVKKQAEVGLTVINDGEQGKTSWTDYVTERLNGYSKERGAANVQRAAQDFPEFFAQRTQGRKEGGLFQLKGVGPLSWKDFTAVETDIANFKAALKTVKVEEGFLTSLSPGSFLGRANSYYATQDDYLHAAAEVMNREYKAIADAGIVVSLDAPDLSGGIARQQAGVTRESMRKDLEKRVEALNYATRGIPQEMLRLHICWGRGENTKHLDAPLQDIVDVVLKARVQALSIVAANARHEWEWKVWKDIKRPEGLILIPGVMDNTTNIIEHPETIAMRLKNFASVVGRENVIGGVDCGFGDAPWISPTGDVEPKIAWAKLKALADGANLATKELWKK